MMLKDQFLQNKTTHQIKTTTDPGRALITGLWKDVGRMKGHNGSAQTLRDVVDSYSTRFATDFSQQDQQDLVDFLSSLCVSLIAAEAIPKETRTDIEVGVRSGTLCL